jgi:hypothetical protein
MKIALLAFVLCTLLPGTVVAGPADYIYTPAVQHGEREIDFKIGEASPLAGNSVQGASIGFGYGVGENWFTEVYLKQERNGNADVTLAEWENKFQLTETGKYPVDLGFVIETEAPLGGNEPWELRLGPLLQTEFGKLQLNGNLLFARAFGMADETGVPYSTNIGYQWQVKYRLQPIFEFGLQGMGEMGKWNAWDKQSNQNHRFGPAIFGKYSLENRKAIKYNAAWLFGASPIAPNHILRVQVEYEF